MEKLMVLLKEGTPGEKFTKVSCPSFLAELPRWGLVYPGAICSLTIGRTTQRLEQSSSGRIAPGKEESSHLPKGF